MPCPPLTLCASLLPKLSVASWLRYDTRLSLLNWGFRQGSLWGRSPFCTCDKLADIANATVHGPYSKALDFSSASEASLETFVLIKIFFFMSWLHHIPIQSKLLGLESRYEHVSGCSIFLIVDLSFEIVIIPFPLLSSLRTLPYTHHSLSDLWPLLWFNHTHIHIYIYDVCMHTYIFINNRYKLFSLQTATCMYDFRVDYLVLDNQLVGSCLGKTISFALSILSTRSSWSRVETSWAFAQPC